MTAETSTPPAALDALVGRRLLVGVTGAIAALMVPPSLIWLRRQSPSTEIQVVLTARAAAMVPPATLAVASGRRAWVDWPDASEGEPEVTHLALAAWADAVLIMPATANTLSRLARGAADDLLSTCVLGATCPIFVAPAMNRAMWEKPATQRNVVQLRDDGFRVIEPVEGWAVAHQATDAGAMADVPTILAAVAAGLPR
jgi:phosphopantothenoylcysteine synthetase/decarboxylase